MNEYLVLMHADAADDGSAWGPYLQRLRGSGQFDGGSSIGAGVVCRKGQADAPAQLPITGFLRVRAADLQAAQQLVLPRNPVYEAGGTVEVRALLRD